MGHRALIAYEQDDGNYTVLYSHWGAGSLAERITPETPLGGENDLEPPYLNAFASMLDDAVEEMGAELSGKMAEAPESTAIEPDPVAVGVTFRDITHDVLDYIHHEAFYVVDRDFNVTEYRPYWVGFDHGSDDPAGLLTTDGSSYELGVYRGFRISIEDLIENDVIDRGTARERLLMLMLERYADDLHDHVVAQSPAVGDDEYRDHPCAFVEMGGRSRVLGEMYPTAVRSPPDWELPADFPAIKTAEGERVEI